jgi:hypothetical protein
MNSFRTTFSIPEFNPKMSYHSKSLFIGSCFTENIGNYLKELKFQITNNPTGIIYNPISICECIRFLLDRKQLTDEDLHFNNDLWFSFKHHGRYSNSDKNECLKRINEELKLASDNIIKADFLFITLGTAFVYTNKEKDEVVANCHKLPSSAFSKSLLNSEAVINEFDKLLKDLFSINRNIKVIFTVSPVRHWNDGAIENQVSKSVLITSIHELVLKHKSCSYFPAYELMMDDLRDYRFYAEDMLHPNTTAIEYIRNKFVETYIDNESSEIMRGVQKLLLAKNHKPFNAETVSHRNFLKKNLDQLQELNRKFPFLELEELEAYFKKG